VELAMIYVQDHAAVRPHRPRHLGEHGFIARNVEVADALPHADHRVDSASRQRDAAHVGTNEGGGRSVRGSISQRRGVPIETGDAKAGFGERDGVPPRAAAEVEHPAPRTRQDAGQKCHFSLDDRRVDPAEKGSKPATRVDVRRRQRLDSRRRRAMNAARPAATSLRRSAYA